MVGYNPKATNIVALWKHLVLEDERYSESELDSLLIGSGKPCRRSGGNVLKVLCSILAFDRSS